MIKALFLISLCFCMSCLYSQNVEESIRETHKVSDYLYTVLSIAELDSIIDHYHYRSEDIAFHELYLGYLIKEAIRLNEDKQVARCYNKLGKKQRNNAMFAKALASHLNALKYSKNDPQQNIESNNDIGVVYRRMDKPRLALRYHMLALKLVEEALKTPNDQLLFEKCIAMNSIGNLNLTLQQPKQALNAFQDALILETQRGNKLGMAINFNNIGFAYELLKDNNNALNFYRKSLKANTDINSNLGRCISYNSMGSIYLKMEQLDHAKQCLDSAYYFSSLLNDPYHASQVHGNLARVYLMLKEYPIAFSHLDTLRTQALFIESGSITYEADLLFSEYYEALGKSDSALFYYKSAIAFNDSIVNEKNARYLNEIQTVYDTEKKAQAIDFLTAENEIKYQRSILYLIAIVALLFAIIMGFMDFLRRKKRNVQEQESLKQQLLRMQMNPHFLFNALGSIQNYMYKNETKKAAAYLSNFAKLTRAILEHTTQEFIPLVQEVETLNNYLALEQLRSNDSFEYHIKHDPELDVEFIDIPPMLIQPFAENAVKHGLKNLPYPGLLEISFEELDDKLQIKIFDNGHGICKDKKPEKSEHRSMSMEIFEKRKKALAKKFKKSMNYSVQNMADIDPSKTGTIVEIQIPI